LSTALDDEPAVEPEKDAAPKPRRAPRSAAQRSRRKAKDSLEAPIRAMLDTIGGVVAVSESMRLDADGNPTHPTPTCGEVLQAQAGAIAKSLAILAAEDPSVYKWLSAATTGGGWGGVAFTVLPVLQAIVFNHAMPALERRAAARQAWQPMEEQGWLEPVAEQVPPDDQQPT
jgi:hypothetical protein